ncbi:hypothetical protein ADIARSV_3799 [Arcticibacter svalbardensis MN12-7]|uniref:Transposase n=1 Tax=Arcticibacter svalbardensis MN12-7 TaxID=1150600 RepID=R9GMT9_9SPHI|nr:hypothetical protein [Arcticibacter svalbardensis]EOR93043.1 hypothetical protein ADIARSV_3799 [Arcticibacter svalbardensis MN12-7]
MNQGLQSEMLRHVNDWQHSGLSQIGYCQEKGISFSKFNYWVRKARPSEKSTQGFLAIKVETNAAQRSVHPVMELISPRGIRLNFYGAVDAEFIKKLL